MDSFDDTALALTKFGVGQPVPRKEDPTLLRGEGRYTDDIEPAGPGLCGAWSAASIAHGILKGIDGKAATAMPGVLAILTDADMAAAGFGPMKCGMNFPQRDGSPMKSPPRHSLAKDRVRYVGEAVACRGRRDARRRPRTPPKLVELDIEALPAVDDAAAGARRRRAAAPRRGAGQPGARLPLRRCRGGEARPSPRRRTSPASSSVTNRVVVNADGAALGDRR